MWMAHLGSLAIQGVHPWELLMRVAQMEVPGARPWKFFMRMGQTSILAVLGGLKGSIACNKCGHCV